MPCSLAARNVAQLRTRKDQCQRYMLGAIQVLPREEGKDSNSCRVDPVVLARHVEHYGSNRHKIERDAVAPETNFVDQGPFQHLVYPARSLNQWSFVVPGVLHADILFTLASGLRSKRTMKLGSGNFEARFFCR